MSLLAWQGVRVSLHAMVASNELDPDALIRTARLMLSLAVFFHETHGIAIQSVNIGGGWGIPYLPDQPALKVPPSRTFRFCRTCAWVC